MKSKSFLFTATLLGAIGFFAAAGSSDAQFRRGIVYFEPANSYSSWPNYGHYYPGFYGSYSYTPDYYYYYAPTVYYNQTTFVYIPPTPVPQTSQSSESYQGGPESPAKIEITVPPKADLWFDGKKTSQTGNVRYFMTPPLIPGQSYFYDVRATWKDGAGDSVTSRRTIDIQAGQRATVNMMEQEK